MQNFVARLTTILILGFGIAACGGSGSSSERGPTVISPPDPTATPTPAPTATPTPEPTPTPTPEPVNIIANGSFEDDSDGDTPSGLWNTADDNGKATFRVIESIAGENARTGTKAIEVVVNELGENTYSIELTYGPLNVEAGSVYNYSFWIKGSAGSQVDFTAGATAAQNFLELARTSLTMNGDWQQATLTVSVNADINQIRLPTHFSIAGNVGATFYLDDLSLTGEQQETDYSPVNVASLVALSPNGMPIGVAVPAGSAGNSILTSSDRANIVTTHFNQITAENIMKMSFMQPSQGNFSFADADALVNFATNNNMSVHGHALVWHNQMPIWMMAFSGDRDAWIAMMEDHIQTVAAHFHTAGTTVTSWDVVNEAFSDDSQAYQGDNGGYRGILESGSTDSPWYDNIGPEYIELAFLKAREADPDADLYYNDYNLLFGGNKFQAAVDMINDFQARNIPIDGLGFQSHVTLNGVPIATVRSTLQAAVNIQPPIKIKLTELDVRLQGTGVLSAAAAEEQKQYYHDLVEAYLDVVPEAQRGGITVWGITDGDSWVNSFFPGEAWPLLFFDDFTGKPALQGFADALEGN